MENRSSIWKVLSLLIVLPIIIKSCEPTSDWGTDIILMINIDSLTMTSAVLVGVNYHVIYGTSHGFYWSSTSANPSEKDNKIDLGPIRKTNFKSKLSGLIPGTKYYVKAYLENSVEKGESMTAIFTTLPEIPIVITSFVHEFTKTSAIFGGQVASHGMAPVTDQGIYWGLSPEPETTGVKLQIGN